MAYALPNFGCFVVSFPADTAFAANLLRDLLAPSALRAGLETPPGLPLFRLTAGVGVAWGSPRLPLDVTAIGWSTRSQRIRFLIDVARARTRVGAEEIRHDCVTHGPDVARSIRPYPVIHTLRMGVELPLRAGQ